MATKHVYQIELKKTHTNRKRLIEIAPSWAEVQLDQESRRGQDLSRHQAMEDQLRLCTLRLLTDYLEYCTQWPSSTPNPTSSLEATVMCSIASQVQECYQLSWTCYRQCQNNHMEMVANAMQNVFWQPLGPNWGRVVVLVTFTGFLLERPLASHTWALK